MFLDKLRKENGEFVEAVFGLHQKGLILPDSYVVDVDRFLENSQMILDKAAENHIKLYFMMKQLGRNPYLAQELVKMGYDGAVAVDFKEAKVMMKHGIPIGNAGHLVQVPDQMVEEIVAYGAEVITVYSLDKIGKIDIAARSCGKIQKLLLRVYDTEDMIYSGQTAGFSIDILKEVADEIREKYKHVAIAGITSFPCYLYNEDSRQIEGTNNLKTVFRAVSVLQEAGFHPEIINTPSSTCCRVLDMMKADGGNCGEPGHGLTGTTPAHAEADMEEKPCVLYLSEISHNFMGRGYCYGGGHYRRSHVKKALVGTSSRSAAETAVEPPDLESIDYHFGLDRQSAVGDTVIMAYRFQIFVTRSDVVLVKGISRNKPEIIGVYDSLGNKK